MADKEKYRVSFADCYVLTNKRSKDFIHSFLNKFLPNRKEYTDSYEVPQFSNNPTITFKSADELINYLDEHKKEVHGIYWYNKDEAQLKGAMCLFTSDGQVILGIFCETLYPDTTNEKNYLNDIMNFCNSSIGLIEYEKPAAHDTKEFLERIAADKKRGNKS